jgi:hypothetical protein
MDNAYKSFTSKHIVVSALGNIRTANGLQIADLLESAA